MSQKKAQKEGFPQRENLYFNIRRCFGVNQKHEAACGREGGRQSAVRLGAPELSKIPPVGCGINATESTKRTRPTPFRHPNEERARLDANSIAQRNQIRPPDYPLLVLFFLQILFSQWSDPQLFGGRGFIDIQPGCISQIPLFQVGS